MAVGEDFWSWFELAMKDELARCSEGGCAEARRDYIAHFWLQYAPTAGNC